jgi:hypothetical protein
VVFFFPHLSRLLPYEIFLLEFGGMTKNDRKFQRFVEATRSLAYWSRELLKVIEKPEKSGYQPTERGQQSRKGRTDE